MSSRVLPCRTAAAHAAGDARYRPGPDPQPPSRHHGSAGGGLGCLRRRKQPLRQPRLPGGAGGQRQRHRPQRLAAAACRAARCGGPLVACAPCYAKTHSQGEYVFDYGWADAFERAGGNYYPKLQVCAPFSPVPGPRLLIRPGSGVGPAALGQGLVQVCAELELSSVHVTFCEAAEWEALGEAGWLQRIGTQFHWHNHGYASFEDFLGALSSRKRKAIRRERRDAAASGFVRRRCAGLRSRRSTGRPSTASTNPPPTRNGAAAPTSPPASGR